MREGRNSPLAEGLSCLICVTGLLAAPWALLTFTFVWIYQSMFGCHNDKRNLLACLVCDLLTSSVYHLVWIWIAFLIRLLARPLLERLQWKKKEEEKTQFFLSQLGKYGNEAPSQAGPVCCVLIFCDLAPEEFGSAVLYFSCHFPKVFDNKDM